MKGFAPYLRRHAWQWAGSALCALGGVAAALAIPRLVGHGVDALGKGRGAEPELVRFALGMVVAAALSSVCYVGMRRLAGAASRQVAYELRRDLFAHLTRLDLSYFQRTRTGDLMNRLTGDLSAVQEMLGFALTQAVNALFFVSLSLALMIRLSLPLGLTVLGAFPFALGMLVVLFRVVARRYAAVQEQQSTVAARAQESFSGARVVRGYAVEDREVRDYTRLNAELRRRALRLAQVEGPLWSTGGLMVHLLFLAVLTAGILRLRAGHSFGGLSVGGYVTFTAYLFQLTWPMLSIGLVANLVQRGLVSWGRLRVVLDEPPAIRDGDLTDARVESLHGHVRFENVSLALGGRRLLEGVSFDAPAGSVMGLTGRTGAGKSLVMALLTRTVEPTSGRILIDGHPLDSIPLRVLREGMGVVAQEPFLFSETLAENIAFGLEETDSERVQWAGAVAGLQPDVEAFPARYETLLGERGVTLSGGQRQRTALARALAKKPPILILDDALSAVDTETEARILSGLRPSLGKRTVFLVAHRISTLRHAEQILVIDQGRVVERGSHAELLERGGLYAELDRRQRLEQALAREKSGP